MSKTDIELLNESLIENNAYTIVDAEGNHAEGSDSLLRERTIRVYVDGSYAGSIPHTPQYVRELIIGWLNDCGFINELSEIDNIAVSEDGGDAFITICGGNHERDVRPVEPIPWKKEWIFELAKDFKNILPLRKATMAAHNCRLAKGTGSGAEIVFKCEDIGRHSAIDKTIGWAMTHDVDMKECMLFTSGRISRAMVHKVIRAGIPVMAGKGTISGEAVTLAKENSLTIIGYSKENSICIFNDEA